MVGGGTASPRGGCDAWWVVVQCLRGEGGWVDVPGEAGGIGLVDYPGGMEMGAALGALWISGTWR